MPDPLPQKAADKAAPNMMTGGFGVTWIDGDPYYALSLAPEVSLGKFGLGLDINFYISSKDPEYPLAGTSIWSVYSLHPLWPEKRGRLRTLGHS